MKRQSGYTLLEMLVAVSIFSIVTAAIGTSAVACLRLCRTAVVEAELSLRTRELREKLLFHVRQPTTSAAYDGLLSAPSTSRVDSVAFFYDGEQLPLTGIASGNRARQSHRLILTGAGRQTYPMDDHAPHDVANLKWLRPGGFYMDGETYNTGAFITTASQTARNGISCALVRLALTATQEDGSPLGRRDELLIVPFLNSAQDKVSNADLLSLISTASQSAGGGTP